MQFTYQLTAADYRAGLRASRRKSAVTRWIYRLAFVLFLGLCGVTSLLLFSPRRLPFGDLLPLYLLIAFWVYVLWLSSYLSARRQFRGSPSAQGPITMELSDAGVRVISQHSDSNIGWKSFVRFAQTPSVFALFTSPVMFLIVPKRALNGDDLAEFHKLLSTHIPS